MTTADDPTGELAALIDRIAGSTPLSRAEARRVVLDVIAYLAESPEEYVARRHLELKKHGGLRNEAIFERLQKELGARVFAAPPLTDRQLRRIIYG